MNQRLWIVYLALAVGAGGCSSSDNPKVDQDGAPDTAIGRDGGPDIDPSQCFAGGAFLACSGPDNPQLYCSQKSCKWVSVGHPVGKYQGRIDNACNCTGPTCPDSSVVSLFTISRGLTPWTRERSLVVKASLDSSLSVSQHAVTCTGCTASCAAGDSPCKTTQLGLFDRSLPGTFRLLVGPMGYLYGWVLELEVDLAIAGGPKARVCRLPVTDVIQCEPKDRSVCATSGIVTLSAKPAATNLAVAVSYDVTFPDGVKLKGTVAAQ